ncbi:MAG: DNA-3-methyladenine glycosylase [Verrucomicrobiaceae bacterium]|nr:DNA-3-methyladenine glycosylase [Verrucomicrobiaceae bacterium]
MTPDYWKQACAELSTRCAVMEQLIAAHPEARLRTRGNPFQTLARAIVGQQISVKAAQSVWNKTELAVGKVTPANVLLATDEGLRAAGLSRQKVSYLRDLSARFADGRIKPRRWQAMPDDAIIAELVEVKGIGRWTAEMFLIFYLMRPNVWPVDDIGVIRAMEKHYHGGERIVRKQMLAHLERFDPWATVAAWYLWRSIESVPVEY